MAIEYLFGHMLEFAVLVLGGYLVWMVFSSDRKLQALVEITERIDERLGLSPKVQDNTDQHQFYELDPCDNRTGKRPSPES